MRHKDTLFTISLKAKLETYCCKTLITSETATVALPSALSYDS